MWTRWFLPAHLLMGSILLAALALFPGSGGAQPYSGQRCVNLSGTWASNDDFAIGLEQVGCELHSTYTQAQGYDHSIQGRCAGGECSWRVFRRALSTGCRTVLFGTATLLDANHFRTVVTGSDGRCDLPPSYSETRIYRRS